MARPQTPNSVLAARGQLAPGTKHYARYKAQGRVDAPADPHDVRNADEVASDIADVRAAISSMHSTLRAATADINRAGLYVKTTVLDSNGQQVEVERVNPSAKIQRETLAALRSFKKHLQLLLDEQNDHPKPAKEMTSKEKAMANADRLLAEMGE